MAQHLSTKDMSLASVPPWMPGFVRPVGPPLLPQAAMSRAA
jgi:hypothetical protein